MIRCLCCGQEAIRRPTPMTEADKVRALAMLTLKGYTVDNLLTNRRCIESLDYTSPEFLPWLRDNRETLLSASMVGRGGPDGSALEA